MSIRSYIVHPHSTETPLQGRTSEFILLGSVFLVAVIFRMGLWAATEAAGTPRYRAPGQDPYGYMLLARNLLGGRGYIWPCNHATLDEPALTLYFLFHARPDGASETWRRISQATDLSRVRIALCRDSRVGKPVATALPTLAATYPPPGYPLLLAAFWRFAGDKVFSVVTFLQCLADAATAVLISLCLVRLAPQAPIWLHFVWPVYLPAAAAANELLTEAICIVLIVSAVVAALLVRSGWWQVTTVGLSWSGAVLIRAQYLMTAPVIAALVYLRARGTVAKKGATAACSLLPGVLLLGIWAIRNYSESGHLALGPPPGGLLFYSVAAPAHALEAGHGRLAESQRVLLETYAPVLFDRPRDIFEFQRLLGECARDWLRNHPLAALKFVGLAVWKKIGDVNVAIAPVQKLTGTPSAAGAAAWPRSPSVISRIVILGWGWLSVLLALTVSARFAWAVVAGRPWRNTAMLALVAIGLLTAFPVVPLANRRYVLHFLPFWLMASALVRFPIRAWSARVGALLTSSRMRREPGTVAPRFAGRTRPTGRKC